MKNRFAWPMAMLAILTFSLGQATAAAGQVVQSRAPSATTASTLKSVTAASTVKSTPAAVKPASTVKSASAAAVKPAPAKTAAATKASTFAATDPTVVPHYFGPFSNWANSPQVQPNAIVTVAAPTGATPAPFGNSLVARANATDTSPFIFAVLPNTQLPAGNLQSFQIWNQGGAAVGQTFHAYVLRPTGTANQYTVIYDSGVKTVPSPTVPSGEVTTFAIAPAVAVQQNDVIGWYGDGIPFDIGTTPGSATLVYPAGPPPALSNTFTLGVDAGFPIFPQDRTYSFGAMVTPGATATATATVDSKTGGVTGYTVTDPGSGYTAPPTVTVTSPGVPSATGAAGTAVLGSGVISSISVDQSGFGYTTPSVGFTGGGGSGAVAVASGGVDSLTLTPGSGHGYTLQPIVQFSLPDAAYCLTTPPPVPACQQPTATATKDGAGVVDSITLTGFGTGYRIPPTVTVLDGNTAATFPATVSGTVNVDRVDIINGGSGYTSAPTVAITDTGTGGTGSGATATATVATAGAVTAINSVSPGTGYLTPGMKKFQDTLSGFGPTNKNNLNNYVPVAVPDTTTYPGTDYYEIAVVQFRQQFATGLPPTLLRGYVQLSTTAVPGAHVQLTNANVDSAVADTTITGRFGVDKPYYLGPTIVANKNRPVRVLFRNLLPTGVAGNLFLPTDTMSMGAGQGPGGVTLDANHVPMMDPGSGTVTDTVRNPVCGTDPKPVTCYTENRATLHLHGGITPWISDGTPHQWTSPAGESGAYPKGVSVSNVPDMPDPGPGAETFFYTNQQSARLMFYHDHAWGITRLNVYAGEAAGYLLNDATEAALTGTGGPLAGLGAGTPLMIQDKTFVPANIATTDPTWNAAKWGGTGSLWNPHVYMPFANPSSPGGTNPFGRWIYGPWFWPPATGAVYPPIANPYYDPNCDPNVAAFCEPPQIPSTPNNSQTMEAFQDTPVVNGTAYPTTSVDPKAYRFRILNAGNDRFWNLQWYVADPSTGTLSEVALNPTQLAAAQTDPTVVPTPDLTKSPKGPNWIQIGNEGGFLPTPAVIPPQPITWITDPTRFDAGNVDKHSLLVAPAERADVVVDFSQYRGKTLILYNDAPAAFPARQANEDFYTGGPDMTGSGGAPTTLAGYGPNTRTIMQVKVSANASAAPFNMAALNTAFAHHSNGSGVFESSQDPTIVGQAAYNTAYGSAFVTSGYCSSVSLPAQRCDGFARIQQQGGDTFQFNTLGPLKNGTGPKLGIPLQPKGIHDEANSTTFDPYGRMQASMGLEAPGATPILQNIILYPFVNPATEILDSTGLPSSLNVTPISSSADGTQIWKITHNGVDTHPLHFHLYNVQVLNRVTWDNIIMPPDANEVGWKETVRVSPLEDTYVAVRPIKPTLPFGVPDSSRPLNPAMPLGAQGDQTGPNGDQAGFNNTDALGNPIAPIVNAVANFGWEYVWHCHMLSHEEMDMMRPVTVQTARALPAAPNPVTSPTSTYTLNWVDGTPVNYADPTTWSAGSNPGTSEIGFRIERASMSNTGVVGAYSPLTTALANSTTYTDATAVAGQRYMYKVIAFNAAGDAPGTPVMGGPAVASPGAPTIGVATPASTSAVVRWTAPTDAGGSPITGYSVKVVLNGTSTQVGALRPAAAGATSLTVTGLTNGTAYQFLVSATNAVALPVNYSAASNAVTPAATATVTRLSDFNRDGFTDLVARESGGTLWLYKGNGSGGFITPPVLMATGWNTFTQIATPGDVTGDGNADIFAVDSAGTLWLYPGNGTSGLGTRVSKGSGWSTFTITDAADMITGGRPDLLARDSAGVLWCYPITGNAVIGTRVQVSAGWGPYTITGPGDVSGDGRADIVARDGAGALWLYPGTGTGTVGARTAISNVAPAYSTLSRLVTPGNWDRAVGNDLLGIDSSGALYQFYGTNAGQFGPGLQIGAGWSGFTYVG
jgi:FtsP/CotA-like multicopper oxidase with cupredoxin domain